MVGRYCSWFFTAGYSGVAYDTTPSALETEAERLIRELQRKRQSRINQREQEDDALSPAVTAHRASVAQGLRAYAKGLASLADFDSHKKCVALSLRVLVRTRRLGDRVCIAVLPRARFRTSVRLVRG